MRSAKLTPRAPLVIPFLAAVAALCLLFAGPARAASTYPPGGGAFSGGAEGWHVTGEPSCNIGLLGLLGLCTASGGYDAANGHPAGSFAAESTIVANLGGLFKSQLSFVSPTFTAAEGGAASLRLERELGTASLLDLTPSATYAVTLADLSTGTSTTVLTDSVAGSEESFAGKSGAATLVAGHNYAIAVSTETSSSVANVGLLGSAALRFDNIALTVGSSTTTGGGGGSGGGSSAKGGSGGAGGNGGAAGSGKFNSLSDARLRSLLRRGASTAPVVMKGKRLFAKVSCPAAVGRACRIVAQGMLNRRKPATTRRTVKVAKGKSKRIVLRVKRKAKKRIAKRKRLLVRESVKAGPAKATLYRSRALIRR